MQIKSDRKPVKVYLSLGSNLGNRTAMLRAAEAVIEGFIGPITAKSDDFETDPVGFESENKFINNVVEVITTLTPTRLLLETRRVEKNLGRPRKSINGVYEDRPIDVDILYYGNEQISTDVLTIPHPRIAERMFVLEPLAQIAPDFVNPASGLTTTQMIDAIACKG